MLALELAREPSNCRLCGPQSWCVSLFLLLGQYVHSSALLRVKHFTDCLLQWLCGRNQGQNSRDNSELVTVEKDSMWVCVYEFACMPFIGLFSHRHWKYLSVITVSKAKNNEESASSCFHLRIRRVHSSSSPSNWWANALTTPCRFFAILSTYST